MPIPLSTPMVTVKIDQLAKKLNKTITDIAKETGLNRNTVTALYHHKVDGVKFATLEKLASTYNVALEDLIELQPTDQTAAESLYRQEAEGVPFYTWPWFNAIALPEMGVANTVPNNGYMHYKNDVVTFHWNTQQISQLAAEMYTKYSNRTAFDRLFQDFTAHSTSLEHLYETVDQAAVNAMSKKELLDFFEQVRSLYENMWKYSAFIDMFDSGFDEKEITRLSAEAGLSHEEMGVLLNPAEMPFYDERELAVLEIVERLLAKGGVDETAASDAGVQKMMQAYGWYRSSYAGPAKVTRVMVVSELMAVADTWEQEGAARLEQLRTQVEQQRAVIREVLDAHNIKSNPLWFFNRLTQWRRHERKRAALIGVHLLDRVLAGVERWTGIDKTLLGYLSFDEMDNALHGLVTKGMLKERREKGVMINLVEDYEYVVRHGDEAEQLFKQLERQLLNEMSGGKRTATATNVLTGQTVYPGVVRGTARVILQQEDFQRLEEGDILVTSMTRPEFYPLLHRAAGVVTVEGGVSSHATRTRDLGIPCVIGVQQAIQVITDGDTIELDASVGEVRLIK